MATHRFPALVWEDDAGQFTAVLVENWENTAAVGSSSQEALRQLKEYLDWSFGEEWWRSAPDFLEPVLTEVKVEIRPEYQRENRVFPCPELVLLRVPCVQGRQEDGLSCCAIPTLNIRFNFHDPAMLKSLVAHFVKNRLQGLTPQQLSRCLPPNPIALHEVVLNVRQTTRPDTPAQPKWETLERIANSLIAGRSARTQFGTAWERSREVQQLTHWLGHEGANVILLGEPGCGKTTVMAEAARKLSREPGDDDQRPARHRFWMTNAARIIAGMQFLGQWEERCEAVIEELANLGGVLCIENLLDLVNTGGDGPGDSIASFFLPYLQRRELRLVVEATPAELDACRRLLPGFADVFQILKLPTLTDTAAVNVLNRVSETRAQTERRQVEAGAMDRVFHLFKRFLPYHSFPGRASRFVHDLFEAAERDKVKVITRDRVITQFIRQTGLPEFFLRDELLLHEREVKAGFEKQIIGQPAAGAAAARLVTTFKAGLNDPARPVGVLLFCGPTGVGKTALARALADYCFGHGDSTDRLLRLDMSEYAAPGSADRLLRKPDGSPSELIQRVRQQPFLVLLLDEIEKTAPEVFDVFLNVFDEGRLTDRLGRLTIFRSAIIVMTSNLGASRTGALGFGEPTTYPFEAEVMSFFRPEFFNRIDAVVTFHPLAEAVVLEITRKELADLAKREGLAAAGLRLSWSESVVSRVAAAGFDRVLGARPLQRALEQLVVTPLARFLVENPGLRECEIRVAMDAQDQPEFQLKSL